MATARPIPTEKTFLEQGEIVVTNSRFVVAAQTYAMTGITSVRSEKETPSRTGPIVLLVLGVLSLFAAAQTNSAWIGVLLFGGLGVLWLVLQKPTFRVKVATAGGEQQALESKDADFVARVVHAVNEAIIYRG